MPSNPPNLSDLITHWSLVLRAVSTDPDTSAMAEVLPQYCASVNLFLRRLLKDKSTADDLCQEFAYRFARGDFRHVRQEKGRFRDYVKVSVLHLVSEHRRQVRHQTLEADAQVPSPHSVAEEYDSAHRTFLLDRAWDEFAKTAGDDHPNLHDVLRRKAQTPEISSADLAADLSATFGKPLTANHARQMLHRARKRFAALLRDQVAALVPREDATTVDDELAGVGLLSYCLPPAR